jgi:hypothetical protein
MQVPHFCCLDHSQDSRNNLAAGGKRHSLGQNARQDMPDILRIYW